MTNDAFGWLRLQSGDHVTHDGRPARLYVVSDVSGYALIRYDDEPGLHRVAPNTLTRQETP